MLIDAHCHAHEFPEKELRNFSGILIAAVSEDVESSRETIRLSHKFNNIVPFAGIHPWNISNSSVEDLGKISNLLDQHAVRGVGEVGIDGRIRRNLDKQIKVFQGFCIVASERKLPMNIHALDAWERVLRILLKNDISKALFHWYTGPVHLLREIEEMGYYISINPAVTVQPRHRKILERASLETILTESDGPYNYKGLKLNPTLIGDLIGLIAEIKDVDKSYLMKVIERNFERFLD